VGTRQNAPSFSQRVSGTERRPRRNRRQERATKGKGEARVTLWLTIRANLAQKVEGRVGWVTKSKGEEKKKGPLQEGSTVLHRALREFTQ